jgi:hypothetical protein
MWRCSWYSGRQVCISESKLFRNIPQDFALWSFLGVAFFLLTDDFFFFEAFMLVLSNSAVVTTFADGVVVSAWSFLRIGSSFKVAASTLSHMEPFSLLWAQGWLYHLRFCNSCYQHIKICNPSQHTRNSFFDSPQLPSHVLPLRPELPVQYLLLSFSTLFWKNIYIYKESAYGNDETRRTYKKRSYIRT